MHTDFIISDIFEILDDAIMSSSGIDQNIANYPLCEYILQSVFLRLTGYQEQKLKCILWEIASDDFEFRYKYLNGSINVGECSRLEDKDKVYNVLKKILEKKGHTYPFPSEDETNRQISEIKERLNLNLKQLYLRNGCHVNIHDLLTFQKIYNIELTVILQIKEFLVVIIF